MDRARKAGFVGNNFVQNQVREKMRQDHIDRLKKIKHRKPGTSVTLDNNPPDVVNKTGVDPKRKANKELFSLITERENKALLQRISTILTAKPVSLEADYIRMKKLIIPKSKGGAGAHDRYIQKKRTENFFKNVEKTQPFYRAKVWEAQYKKQKKNQKFMREVNYKRPPGFVDPFAPRPETPEEERRKRDLEARAARLKVSLSPPRPSPMRRARAASSAAHVDRVRSVRSSKSPGGTQQRGSAQHLGRSPGSALSNRSGGSDHSLSDEDTFDETFAPNRNGRPNNSTGGPYRGSEEDEEDEEDVVELAALERTIRVSEELPTQQQHMGNSSERKLSVYTATAMVECFLVNHEYVVLSALVMEPAESGDGQQGQMQVLFEAEAEISIEDLAVLRSGTDSVAGSSQSNREAPGNAARTRGVDDCNVDMSTAGHGAEGNGVSGEAGVSAGASRARRGRGFDDDPAASSESLGGRRAPEEEEADDAPVAGAALLEASESAVHMASQGRGVGPAGQDENEDEEACSHSLAYDLEALRTVAEEMVRHVELRVDLDGGPRLVLNLVSEEEQLMGLSSVESAAGAAAAGDSSFADDANMSACSVPTQQEQDPQQQFMGALDAGGGANFDWAASTQHTQMSLVSEDELSEMFLEDTTSPLQRCGVQVPVVFSYKPSNNSIGSMPSLVDVAQNMNYMKNEPVYAMLKIFCTDDDQMVAKVHVMTSTRAQFKRGLRPAVVKGSTLSLSTPLPSVIHADPDLMRTFADNLAVNLRIRHDSKTGKNVLATEDRI